MKIAVILLLLVFSLAACSFPESGQNTKEKIGEVVLTPQERRDMELFEVDEEIRTNLGIEENPGYADKRDVIGNIGYTKDLPLESLYLAGYANADKSEYAIVLTIVFSSDGKVDGIHPSYVLDCKNKNCAEVFLEEVSQIPREGGSERHKFLIKGGTVVYITGDAGIEPGWFDSAANGIAERLQIKIANLTEIGHTIKLRNCIITSDFKCRDYFIKNDRIELVLKNAIGKNLMVEEITTNYAPLKGICTTGRTDKILAQGEEYWFELNLSETPSGCEYDKTFKKKGHFLESENRGLYEMNIKYRYADNPQQSYVKKAWLF